MTRVAEFERVSYMQFCTAVKDVFGISHAEEHVGLDEQDLCVGNTEQKLSEAFEAVQRPVRATIGSAGYDIISPFSFELEPGQTAKIPTGLRCRFEQPCWMLAIFPRSSLGFKYRAQLDNTVGIIDSDYYYADNEGHIFVKITNDSRSGKVLRVNKGDRFIQGIFLPYAITLSDNADGERTGGMGSTGK